MLEIFFRDISDWNKSKKIKFFLSNAITDPQKAPWWLHCRSMTCRIVVLCVASHLKNRLHNASAFFCSLFRSTAINQYEATFISDKKRGKNCSFPHHGFSILILYSGSRVNIKLSFRRLLSGFFEWKHQPFFLVSRSELCANPHLATRAFNAPLFALF